MRVVVVGGHTRNIGKTTLAAALIRDLQPLGWTAVKITQYGHGICSLDGEPCGCAPREHAFVLTEETDARGPSDTSRLLAAGARRTLWLRVRQGQLGRALPLLRKALDGEGWVMIESNSILEFIEPDVYLAVLDASRRDFKDSARKFLKRADAFVAVPSPAKQPSGPVEDAPIRAERPCFSMVPSDPLSSELARFVRRKLQLPEAGRITNSIAEKRSSRVRTQ